MIGLDTTRRPADVSVPKAKQAPAASPAPYPNMYGIPAQLRSGGAQLNDAQTDSYRDSYRICSEGRELA
jgi:hypothetical protein